MVDMVEHRIFIFWVILSDLPITMTSSHMTTLATPHVVEVLLEDIAINYNRRSKQRLTMADDLSGTTSHGPDSESML